MSIFKAEDVAAVLLDRELVCADCLDDKDAEAVTAEKIVCQEDIDGNSWYFCDRCKKRVQ